ncbi:MAG: hypothetical protein FIB01_14825 [Gemmatimonadetes bacterium]|nr:hypothetical protein [Gemmatimonadota bacterium]
MRTWPRRFARILLLAAILPACSHVPGGPAPNLDYLSQQQMQEGHFTYVYEAIEAMRANWLVVRGTDSFSTPSQIWVYYDANRLGGVETLRSVRVNDVAYIRHYNGIDATTRWGVGHSAGVIYVSSHQ